MSISIETLFSQVQINPEILAAIVRAVDPTKMPDLKEPRSAYRFEVARFVEATIALEHGFYVERLEVVGRSGRQLDLERAARYINEKYERGTA